MIYTITPNPVLDLSGITKEIIPNEKNYVINETRSAGGNGINVARIVHVLGEKVTVSGFLGGAIGQEVNQLLPGKSIIKNFISIAENTRINLTISNLKTHQQTRFSFPGPHISTKEKASLKKWVKRIPASSVVVFGGSLPHQMSANDISQLIKILNQAGSICIVDMPAIIIKELLGSKPFMIKPNLSEFQSIVGKKVKSIKQIIPLAKKLTKKIPVICITSVENGALLVTQNNEWHGSTPKMKIKSSVGAGDSMVGAFAVQIEKLKTMQSLLEAIEDNAEFILQMALAAACATITKPELQLADKKTINQYFPKIKVRQLIHGR